VTRATLGHVVRHELRLLLRSPVTSIVFAALAAVCLAGAWNGTQWRNEQQRTLSAIRAEDQRVYQHIYGQLADLQRRGDPRPGLQLAGMAWYVFQPEGAVAPAPHIDPRRAEAASSEWLGARHAVLPPAPFSALAIGQSDLHPYYTRVTIRTRPVLVQSDEIENPATLLSGRIDLAFVLLVCWPLLALPLLYNVLSDERERGTLALVRAQPISTGALLGTRLAVRGVLLAGVTIAASMAGLAVWNGLDGVTWTAIAIWTGAIVATATFWIGLAAAVNLTRWRSATNATALAASWIGLVVVAPAVIAEAATWLAPVPSRVELINAIRAAGNLDAKQLAQLVTAFYEEHPDATPSGQATDITAIRGLALQNAIDRQIDPILVEYRAAAARQQAITDRLRYVSPPLLVHDAVIELAGSTTARYRGFAQQVDAYHRAWREYFYPLVQARTTMTRTLYERAPRFEFREEPPAAAQKRAIQFASVPFVVGALLVIGSCLRSR
jgi:ABC-2 type transport system permease protein